MAKRKTTRPAHELLVERTGGGAVSQLIARCTVCDVPIRYRNGPIRIKGRDIADHSGTFPGGGIGRMLASREFERHVKEA